MYSEHCLCHIFSPPRSDACITEIPKAQYQRCAGDDKPEIEIRLRLEVERQFKVDRLRRDSCGIGYQNSKTYLL